jgi:hypothetical protein
MRRAADRPKAYERQRAEHRLRASGRSCPSLSNRAAADLRAALKLDPKMKDAADMLKQLADEEPKK